MSEPLAEFYADELAGCIAATLKAAGDIAPERRFAQAKTGGAHPAWLVGHLAGALDSVVGGWALQAERVLPKGFGRQFAPQFAGGDPITGEAGDYPAWDEILAVYKKVGDAHVAGIRALTAEELEGPLRGNVPDPMRDFFGNTRATISQMIRHDSHHRGQMMLIASLED